MMKARSLNHRRMGFETLEARSMLSAVSGRSNVAIQLEVQHGPSVPAVIQHGATVTPIASADANWAGYAISTATNAVSYVAGTWVVPTLNPKNNGSSAIWVGIDGNTSNTVEQIGTEEDAFGGQATYYAWYEMYPADSVNIPNFTVKPGDSITASTRYDSTQQHFVLTISDTTESETYTTTQTAPGTLRNSAEWVVEAPSTGTAILPLASFGSVTFTNAYATINGTNGPIDYWQAYSINIALSSRGRTLTEASTSPLSDATAASPLPTSSPPQTYAGSASSFTVTRSAAVVANSPPLSQRWSGWGGPRVRNSR